MKLLIKHVDNLKSVDYPDRELIPQYLMYKQTDDGVNISCTFVNGDVAKEVYIEMSKLQHMLNKSIDDDFTLTVENISYEEHNKIINEL